MVVKGSMSHTEFVDMLKTYRDSTNEGPSKKPIMKVGKVDKKKKMILQGSGQIEYNEKMKVK